MVLHRLTKPLPLPTLATPQLVQKLQQRSMQSLVALREKGLMRDLTRDDLRKGHPQKGWPFFVFMVSRLKT
jgi:hypothetical protein